MKKYGGFIPGIRAGKPTAEYLDYVLTRITLPRLALPRRSSRSSRSSRSPCSASSSQLPVRRHQHPDHGRRRSRHRQADREPAAAAQLRRVPALMRAGPDGPARGGQGHPGRGGRRTSSASRTISTGDIFRANVVPGHPARRRGRALHGRRRVRARRGHQRDGARPRSPSRTRPPASCSTATRAPRRRSASSTRCSPSHGGRWTGSWS